MKCIFHQCNQEEAFDIQNIFIGPKSDHCIRDNGRKKEKKENIRLAEEDRPSQLAELSRSKFDPDLFSRSAYVKFFVTFSHSAYVKFFCDIFS